MNRGVQSEILFITIFVANTMYLVPNGNIWGHMTPMMSQMPLCTHK